MRRWLLLLMVVLLPLRVWAGEAMAAQMLEAALLPAQHAPGLQAPAPAAAHHAHAATMPHHDCDEAPTVAAAQPASGPEEAAADDCPTCAHCQACSAVALSPPEPLAPVPSFPQARPQGGAGAHDSAEQPHAFKPPRG